MRKRYRALGGTQLPQEKHANPGMFSQRSFWWIRTLSLIAGIGVRKRYQREFGWIRG